MRTLAIDTASEVCGVGVADRGEILALEELALSAARSRNLAPLIVAVLAASRVALPDIQRIAVSGGPGSFNGLRVGLATAYGLGAALATPIVSVSTLAAMAWSVSADPSPCLAILDARRGEVFAARFAVEGARFQRVDSDALMTPERAMAMASVGDVVLVSASRHGEFAHLEGARVFRTSSVRGLARWADAGAPQEELALASYLRAPR